MAQFSAEIIYAQL